MNEKNNNNGILLVATFIAIGMSAASLFYAKTANDQLAKTQERVKVLEAESVAIKALDFTGRLKELGLEAKDKFGAASNSIKEKAQELDEDTKASEKIRGLFDIFEELVITTQKTMKKLEAIEQDSAEEKAQ